MYVLPYKDSVGILEDRCRFLCGPGHGLPDVEVVKYPQAMENFGRKFGTRRHFGHVPKAPAMGGKDVAGGAEIGPFWSSAAARRACCVTRSSRMVIRA